VLENLAKGSDLLPLPAAHGEDLRRESFERRLPFNCHPDFFDNPPQRYVLGWINEITRGNFNSWNA
jgi:hypothetical protein